MDHRTHTVNPRDATLITTWIYEAKRREAWHDPEEIETLDDLLRDGGYESLCECRGRGGVTLRIARSRVGRLRHHFVVTLTGRHGLAFVGECNGLLALCRAMADLKPVAELLS